MRGAIQEEATDRIQDFDILNLGNVAWIDVREYGATGDGVTDDTAAIQAAITAALAAGTDIELGRGVYRITASVNIDRTVDTTHRKFYIRSSGGAVLYLDSAINMFSSTLTHASQPQSENIGFQGVTFRCDDASRSAFVMHGIKFLRVSFLDCMFDKIKCLYSDRYVQTYMFIGCYIKWWEGVFFEVYGDINVYDLAFIGCWAEAGGTLFRAIPDAATKYLYGIRLIGNLIEGNSGRVIEGGNFRGLEISGNYFESNNNTPGALSAFELDGSSYNYGVSIFGNNIIVYSPNSTTADYYEVDLGSTYGIKVGGNYCDGKLYDNTSTPDLDPHGDYAAMFLTKVLVPRTFYGTAVPTANPTYGDYARADKVWSTTPTAGATPGWVCIESGTFGAATDNTGDTDGSTAVITGMADTSDFRYGSYVDVSAGFPATGPYRILQKTATTLTLDTNSDSAEANITVDTSDPLFKAMASLAA